MKSKTSFFNFTVFKKTVLRFIPIWAGYMFIWLLLMPMTYINNYYADSIQFQIAETIQYSSVVMPFVFGGICALTVFSYLYSQRSAVMFHSLPVSRDGLFVTNYLAGLSFMIIPNIIIYLLTALTTYSQHGVSMQEVMTALNTWLAVTSINCLFFYSLAVLLGMIVGSWFILPVIYLILNFTATVIEYIITAGMELMIYGYMQGESGFTFLSPAAYMLEKFRFYKYSGGVRVLHVEKHVYLYLIALVLVALTFAVLSYIIYKKRNVETAGEIISVKCLRPVFKYGFAVGCSLVIGATAFSIIGYDNKITLLVSMIIGGIIGYLIATMAMNKSFKLKGKALKELSIFIAVIVLIFTVFALDLFGMEGYIPPKSSIEDATVWISGNEVSVSKGDITLQDFIDLHKQVLKQKEESQDATSDGKQAHTMVEFYYKTKQKTVERRYDIPIAKEYIEREGSAQNTLASIINSFEYVSRIYDWLYDGSEILTLEIRLDGITEYYDKAVDTTTDDELFSGLVEYPYVYGDFKAILANPDVRIEQICQALKEDILSGEYYSFGEFDKNYGYMGHIEVTYSVTENVGVYNEYLDKYENNRYKVTEWIPIYKDTKLYDICVEVTNEEYQNKLLKAFS